MASSKASSDLSHANLNLSSEEKRLYGQLFRKADTENLGVITGDIAVKFFERTRLDSTILGEIWQIADADNRGLLTPAGFSIVLRLIGHCQAGENASAALALRPGPLPRFDDAAVPTSPKSPNIAALPPTIQPQFSGAIRVPPLAPEKSHEYAALFERAGARNGLISGDAAKQVFENARLPNEVLGRVWALADTEQRGALGLTEFIIAMHLLTSMRSGNLRSLPQTLPAGLYEAAARQSNMSAASTPRQLAGQAANRTSSPLSRGPLGSQAAFRHSTLSAQSTGNDWLIAPFEKAKYDQFFASVDKSNSGFVTGDDAVQFFSNSGLSEDTLASIWDLADINSEGKLNSDEFAVAMYLIKQQRARKDGRVDLPTSLPPALVPPSMRNAGARPNVPPSVATNNASFTSQPPKSAADDLFGLDTMSSDSFSPSQATATKGADPFAGSSGPSSAPVQNTSPQMKTQTTNFKPFIPISSFGQGLTSQVTGSSVQSAGSQSREISRPLQAPVADDLLGDNDPESNHKFIDDTTELANISNQIGILRSQMQGVQAKKSSAEASLSQTGKEKRDLELRLSQFRSQYEQEVQTVKTLEEQLSATRADTRKMQQEFAMVDGAFKDLQSQHYQSTAALQADQQENASLKERIRQVNAETADLKAQLEKVKSEARQHKGLVAINKKQLSTSESERDRLAGEIESVRMEAAESAESASLSESGPFPAVTSPASITSNQSTNPFMRSMPGSPAPVPSNPMNKAGSVQNQYAFESVFGPSHGNAEMSSPSPQMAFKSSDDASRSIAQPSDNDPVLSTADDANLPTTVPVEYPPASFDRDGNGSLPIPRAFGSSESLSSSVRANPPMSPDSGSRAQTPTVSKIASPPAPEEQRNLPVNGGANLADSSFSSGAMAAAESLPGKATFHESIPGAFPDDEPASAEDTALNEVHDKDSFIAQDDTIAGSSKVTSPGQPQSPIPPKQTVSSEEFPPIQDLNHDDDSDSGSDSELGFENSYTINEPSHLEQPFREASATFAPSGPEPEGAATSADAPASTLDAALPGPSAQSSPPTYDQATSPVGSEAARSHFPREYGGLLPSRDLSVSTPGASPVPQPEVTSPGGDHPSHTGTNGTSSNPFVLGNASDSNKINGKDDFDAAFDDLSEAKEADGQDEWGATTSSFAERDFDPTFDSPAQPKLSNADISPSGATQAFYGNATAKSQASTAEDWDAIFSGLDNSHEAEAGSTDDPFHTGPPQETISDLTPASQKLSARPSAPGRAISTGTEHDDPILQRLTGMGFSRTAALSALEKFDYNLDKAADYLTSSS